MFVHPTKHEAENFLVVGSKQQDSRRRQQDNTRSGGETVPAEKSKQAHNAHTKAGLQALRAPNVMVMVCYNKRNGHGMYVCCWRISKSPFLGMFWFSPEGCACSYPRVDSRIDQKKGFRDTPAAPGDRWTGAHPGWCQCSPSNRWRISKSIFLGMF